MDILEDIKITFKEGSALTKLIYINLGVFLLIKIIGVFFYLSGQSFPVIRWLAVPSDTSALLVRPWTIITYMFLHEGFIHILFNLLGLYWFGKLFLYHFEGNKLIGVYLLGGIAGALLYVAAYNVIPVFQSVNGLLLGASASIFAVLVATAFYDPNRGIMIPLIGTFPLKYVAVFYVLLSVIGISSTNPGGNIAHLGGALFGWFYIYRLGKGRDMSSGIVNFINKIADLFKPKSKMKVSFKQDTPPRDDHEYNHMKHAQQDEINKILEKIAKSGYDSLSKKEKEILFSQGKK